MLTSNHATDSWKALSPKHQCFSKWNFFWKGNHGNILVAMKHTNKPTWVQFPGIVVPQSRDGRIEGSPGRLVRIFYDFRFFHTSRRVGLIFSVASLMKCDLLYFRQWHFRPSYIQNTVRLMNFLLKMNFLQGILFSHCNYLSFLDCCWECVKWAILLRYFGLVSKVGVQIGRTANRCVCLRVKNAVVSTADSSTPSRPAHF